MPYMLLRRELSHLHLPRRHSHLLPRLHLAALADVALAAVSIAWRSFKVFYGAAAVVVAATVVLVMTLSDGGRATTARDAATVPPLQPVQAAPQQPAAPTGDILYVVGTEKDAEYLMAYGDYSTGFPFIASTQALTSAKVRVVVAGSNEDEERVLSMLAAQGYFGDQPLLKVIDLRKR